MITVEQKGGKLIITADIDQDPKASSTGKSKLVASSGGFKPTDVKIKGSQVFVNVMAIIK